MLVGEAWSSLESVQRQPLPKVLRLVSVVVSGCLGVRISQIHRLHQTVGEEIQLSVDVG